VEQALSEAKKALEGGDVEHMRRAHESLTRVSQTLAEAAYRQATARSAGGANAEKEPQDAEVVDAEYENVGDRKD
jgi:molecular chaperone DnaK